MRGIRYWETNARRIIYLSLVKEQKTFPQEFSSNYFSSLRIFNELFSLHSGTSLHLKSFVLVYLDYYSLSNLSLGETKIPRKLKIN